MQLLLAVLTALLVSLAVTPVMVRLAPRLHLLDKPGPRKVHIKPIPRVGGWGIAIGAMVAVLFWYPPVPVSVAFLVGAGILLVGGALDDHGNLPPVTKLLVQLTASIPVLVYAGLVMNTVPLFGDFMLPTAVALPLTVLGLVACTNATNTSDGLDGLAAGVTVLSLVGILTLAYQVDAAEVLVITAATIGGLVGFLRYNTYPATVFMGDAGSQFLGFAVGFLGLALVHSSPGTLSPWLLLLLVGLPVVDLLIVTVRRIRHGHHPFHPDKTHLHHRLMALGFSHARAVGATYSLHASFVFFGVALQSSEQWVILLVFGLHMVLIYGFLSLAERRVSTHAEVDAQPAQPRPFSLVLVWAPRIALELMIPLVLLTLAALATDTSAAFGWLAGFLVLILAACLLRSGDPPALLTRVPTFMMVVTVVYLYTDMAPFSSALALATEMAGITMIGVLAVLAVVFSPRRRAREFRPTALDYLMILLASLALFAVFTGPVAINPFFLIYVPVLLYACELLLVERRERHDLLLLTVAACGALLFVRGVLL